jgi:hypothetical protein
VQAGASARRGEREGKSKRGAEGQKVSARRNKTKEEGQGGARDQGGLREESRR